MQEIQKEIDPKEQGRTTKPRYNRRVRTWLQKENIIATLGIILIQGALIPSNITGDLPHWTLPTFILAGLCCYMYKAIIDNDAVYMLSNSIGMTINIFTLIRIFLA